MEHSSEIELRATNVPDRKSPIHVHGFVVAQQKNAWQSNDFGALGTYPVQKYETAWRTAQKTKDPR